MASFIVSPAKQELLVPFWRSGEDYQDWWDVQNPFALCYKAVDWISTGAWHDILIQEVQE